MHDPGDLARLAAGIPVAALLPWSLPRVSQSTRLATLIAAACAAIVAAPLLPGAAGWVALMGPPAAVLLTRKLRGPGGKTKPNTPAISPALPILAPAFAATIASLVVLDASDLWQTVQAVIDSNAFVIVASGAAAAVFLGSSVVAGVLSPFSAALARERQPGQNEQRQEELKSLKSAGTLIGWFERALFFTLLVAGAPEAAALALTAKSVARFPLLSKHEEGFAEYFLIGTLTSLTIAMGMAIAVRGALGMSPL